MPWTQPSQQYCQDCQYCSCCDPTPDQSRQNPRICRHNQRLKYVEPNTLAAADHRCYERAPVGTRTSSGQQPDSRPIAQSRQTPLNQSQPNQTDVARKGATFSNLKSYDYVTARFGFDYRETPDVEGPMLFTNIESSGHASVHAGNTYGYENPRVAGPPPPGSHPGVYGLGNRRVVDLPATNPFATDFMEDDRWMNNNPYRRR